jgi:Phosphotransferase enzyme family
MDCHSRLHLQETRQTMYAYFWDRTLVPSNNSELKAVTLDAIVGSELTEEQRVHLASLLSGDTNTPFAQVGWIDQAITWLESETGREVSSKSDIEQHNAGGGFSLVRFHTRDKLKYWLKATGEPNAHELAITRLLSELGGTCLPEMISSRPAWNAWLMSGEATQVTELPSNPFKLLRLLEDAVESMAELQMKTEGCSLDLLDAGAFDQGMDVFQKHSVALFDYLEEAMSVQNVTKAPSLDKTRLKEVRAIFEDVCRRAEDLDLPETIVHGDLNHGNILTGCGHCQFIDWSEAYLGNPLVSLQHLLLLNKVENLKHRTFGNRVLKDRYRELWLTACNPTKFDEGFAYMPLLAIASTLYGRGDWLTSPERSDPHRQSYARSLARCMDRAVREPELLEALCR